MTYREEQYLLKTVKENNMMLRAILKYLHGDNAQDFMGNVIANLVANKLENKY